MSQVRSLLSFIRENRKVTIGQACMHLNVGPWQIERYAKVILSAFPDIRFDGETFETIVQDAKQKFDLKQREVVDYVSRLQDPKKT